MSKANIYFSDGSIIEISENDVIITVTPRSDGKSKFSSSTLSPPQLAY